jgi:hypothetical protein
MLAYMQSRGLAVPHQRHANALAAFSAGAYIIASTSCCCCCFEGLNALHVVQGRHAAWTDYLSLLLLLLYCPPSLQGSWCCRRGIWWDPRVAPPPCLGTLLISCLAMLQLSNCLCLCPLYRRTAGELVLWGATLWDPRVPAPLHTFDQLSSNAGGAGGIFHPNGGEIILNSEVGAAAAARSVASGLLQL